MNGKTGMWLAAAALAAVTGAPLGAAAQGTVQTLCSGVGEEARQQAEAGQFTLKIVAAQPDGHYLGGFTTRITQNGSTVAEGSCEGPWFLAELPAGRYTVEASHEGQTKTQAVNVGSRGTREVTFTF